MKGTLRIFTGPDDGPHRLQPGEYGQWVDGWYAIPPGTQLLANLGRHSVTQHNDATITVNPSILVSDGRTKWHGFLERGVWRQVP